LEEALDLSWDRLIINEINKFLFDYFALSTRVEFRVLFGESYITNVILGSPWSVRLQNGCEFSASIVGHFASCNVISI
jgi:hypothetical protein